MSLELKPLQVCPYANICPYNNQNLSNQRCQGADEKRDSIFHCTLVNNGTFVEGKYRSSFDKTGKMEVIHE